MRGRFDVLEPGTPKRAPLALLPLVLAVVLTQGCAGDGPAGGGNPDEPGDPVAFERIQAEIFDVNCQAAGCHNGQSRAGNLDLSPGRAYEQLVGVPPDNAAARSAGLLRVAPLEPGRSFLLRKLEGPAAGEGSRMPLGQTPLSSRQIAVIRAWIAAGAPPASGSPDVPASPTVTPTPSATPPAGPSSTPTPGTASPDPTVTPTPFPPGIRFADLQNEIFLPRCALSGCHTTAARAGFLVLEGSEARGQLVGVPPFQPAAQAEGLLRVAAGDPARSFLLVKLEGPDPRFGSPMPLVGNPLSPAEIDRIRAWIAAGAPP